MSGKVYGIEDMVLLNTVSEDSIVSNLEKRFKKDEIYTNIGPVLIVCNPFKWLKIYEPDTIAKYEKGSTAGEELPPHVFAVAENAFRTMLYEEEKQCVIISGESGAGKTEAAKQIMSYVAAVSGSGANDVAVTQIKTIILESNPALESFGNAMTLRNNNSSRFGKYFEIKFDLGNGGTPTGGYITNYLLEKSRIVKPGTKERGFHIFYQLLAAANKNRSDLKNQFHLKPWNSYKVLNGTGVGEINNDGGRVDDVVAFEETLESLATIGISGQKLTDFLRIVALCLHLSNLEFIDDHSTAGNEGSVINNPDLLRTIAELMEINDARTIEHAITYRTLSTTGPGGTVETYEVPNNSTQARASRDALSKSLYSRLFDLLVSCVNDCLKSCGSKTKTAQYRSSRSFRDLNGDDAEFDPFGLSIGVLDIYGFEIFNTNLFEQFCINYVNEKLQQVFINLTIKSEQEDYASEGIQWTPIPFFDNQIVCDLVEGKKPPGILLILDDTCKTLTKMANVDNKFLEKVSAFQRSNKHLQLGHPGVFTVKHYAGDVTYTVQGFLESNKDVLVNDLKLLAQSCGNAFIRSLYPETVDFSNKRAPTTAGFKIRNQCASLVNTLLAGNPHYVRCIKSNAQKRPKVFETQLVQHQVRYLGLLENIKVRRAGFAFRVEFFKFAARFRVLAAGKMGSVLATGTDKEIANAVLKAAKEYVPGLSNPGEAQLGLRKLFIKNPETVFELQKVRKLLMHKEAVKIQNLWRRYISRRQLSSLRLEMESLWQSNGKQATPVDLVRPYNAFYIKDSSLNDAIASLLEYIGEREKLKYTDTVQKLTKKNEWERTIFFITNKALYYGRSGEKPSFILQRRIELKEVEEIVLSMEADDLIGIKLSPQQVLSEPDESNFVAKKSVKRCMETQTKFSFFGRHRHRCHYTGGIYIKESVATKVAIPDRGYYSPVHVHKSVVGKISTEMREDLVFLTEKKAELGGLLRDLVSRAKGEVVPVANSEHRPNHSKARTIPSPPPVFAPVQDKLMCEALYDYTAQQPDELTIRAGDKIEVVDSTQNDWWTGELNGKSGLIPSNYVKTLKTAVAPSLPMPPPATEYPTNDQVNFSDRNYRVSITFSNFWQIRIATVSKLSNTTLGPVVFSRQNGIREILYSGTGDKGKYEVNVPPGVATEVLQRIRYNQEQRRAQKEIERLRLEELRKQNAKEREAARHADRQRRLEAKKAKRRELQQKTTNNGGQPSWAKAQPGQPYSQPSQNRENNRRVNINQNRVIPGSVTSSNAPPAPFSNATGIKTVRGPVNVNDSIDRPKIPSNRPTIPKNRPNIPSNRPSLKSNRFFVTTTTVDTMSYDELLKRKTEGCASLDKQNLEKHLDVKSFKKVFGMSEDEFSALKKWQQNQKKKAAKLF